MKICSACLLGVRCRYDGKSKLNTKVLQLSRREILIPVCPEQLGGLPTPREFSEKKGERIITRSGKDVTANCVRGAREVVRLARLFGVKEAILKQMSPSCGNGKIYDGIFSFRVIDGDGVTTSLLKRFGITVQSEDDL